MSRPTVVTVCMFGSSESWGLNSTHYLWHSCAGGGAVHSIKTGCEQSQQTTQLFDHLVGDCEYTRRDGEAERFRGLHVNHQLEFCGLLDRQIGRLLALDDAAHVDSSLAVRVHWACAITHQTAGYRVVSPMINRGYPVTGS